MSMVIATLVTQPDHHRLSDEEWTAFQGSLVHLRMRRNRVICDLDYNACKTPKAMMWNTRQRAFHHLVMEWLSGHTTNFYYVSRHDSRMTLEIYFYAAKDAFAFKLKFGGAKFTDAVEV